MGSSRGLKNGLYRNSLGSELHVTGLWMPYLDSTNPRVKTLGDIYHADSRDSLFGTWQYLVTPVSMEETGHVLVEEEAAADE